MFKLVSAVIALGALLAPAAWAIPMSTHDYEFAGTLADAQGGPALTTVAGGMLGTAASPGFRFGAGDGLQLAGGVAPGGPWSVELLFDYDSQGRYEKIIDFSNRVSDPGLYTTYDTLSLYPVALAPAPQLTSGVLSDLVLTRSLSGALTAYVNGVLSFTYDDSRTGIAALGTNPLTFFADDFATNGREAAPGVVQRIRTYDTVLSYADVRALAAGSSPGPVTLPEPGSLIVMVAGVLAVAALRLAQRPGQPARTAPTRTRRLARTGARAPFTHSTSA